MRFSARIKTVTSRASTITFAAKNGAPKWRTNLEPLNDFELPDASARLLGRVRAEA